MWWRYKTTGSDQVWQKWETYVGLCRFDSVGAAMKILSKWHFHLKTTIPGKATEENFVKMTTFPFQCMIYHCKQSTVNDNITENVLCVGQNDKLCLVPEHDDVIIRKHFPRYWPFVRGIHRSPVNSPRKGQWRGTLRFSLISAWINGWVNNREAGDLRRNSAHYDVTVMLIEVWRRQPCPQRFKIHMFNFCLKWVRRLFFTVQNCKRTFSILSIIFPTVCVKTVMNLHVLWLWYFVCK